MVRKNNKAQEELLEKQQSDFLLYTSTNDKIKVDVVLQDETIRLTQKTIVNLFSKSKATITEHHKKYTIGKFLMNSTVRNFRIVQAKESKQGKTAKYFNVIINKQ